MQTVKRANGINGRACGRGPCSSLVSPPALRSATGSRGSLQRVSVASTLVREVPLVAMMASSVVDSDTLNKKLEAKAKALISLEDQEAATWPLVRIKFQKEVGLGDAWKIVGRVPELGRFTPAVAPYLKWQQGHIWTFEGRVRPGTWFFKLVLRRGDGAYVWEDAADRILDVPETAGPDDVLEMTISDVRLEAR